jgi:hypothetical protein
MDFSGFDWRDGVLLLAGAAAVYLLVMVLRLLGMRRRRVGAKEDAPAAESAAEPDWPAQWAAAPEAAAAPAAGPAAPFDEQLAGSRLDLEIRQLRQEMDALRQELNELKAARRVSPQYADAMALARRGYDAQGIAAECGIAVAEAELVLALSRDQMHFDDEVNDGGRNAAGQ